MDKVPGQKQSSASSPSESKNQPSGSTVSATAKPAGKASAAPLEAAKKGNTAKQKVNPKSTASSSKAAKTDDSSADVNARLEKLEKLLQMVVEDRHKGETSRNTRQMSDDRDESPDRGNGGHVQYSETRGRGYDYDPNYEESDELSLGSSLSQDTDVDSTTGARSTVHSGKICYTEWHWQAVECPPGQQYRILNNSPP